MYLLRARIALSINYGSVEEFHLSLLLSFIQCPYHLFVSLLQHPFPLMPLSMCSFLNLLPYVTYPGHPECKTQQSDHSFTGRVVQCTQISPF